MNVKFDEQAVQNDSICSLVTYFFERTSTLETKSNLPIYIFRDGVKGAYYVKCSIRAKEASPLFDFNAKLENLDSFKANRELLLEHNTYKKMVVDAINGREFNDIIVEYNTDYTPEKPLKIWGGQHRSKALYEASNKTGRYHGFRIYFGLNTEQRTELALISNTNISVSNDTFDRMLEETMYGDTLRKFCQQIGLLDKNEDFPDVGNKSERITVKLSRSFIVNFYIGKEKSNNISNDKIDKTIHEPYLTDTGTSGYLTNTQSVIDSKYKEIMDKYGPTLLKDKALLEGGKAFATLHKARQNAVKLNRNKIKNRKSYRNKAFVESIITAWSYVAGLLQKETTRLQNHYKVPKTSSKIPDPLNAAEMSQFKHDQDPKTYRGLGTRSSLKDRQRVAQLFLAKSREASSPIDKKIMGKAVSQVIALKAFQEGYTQNDEF